MVKKLNGQYPIASCIAIISADNYIYVAHRRNKPDALCFPGGKLDKGESIVMNVLRELKEETGVDYLYQDEIIPVYSGFCWPKDKTEEPYWCVGFAIKLERNKDDLPTTKGEEVGIKGQWVAINEFMQKSAFPQYDEHLIKTVKMLYHI